MARILVLFSLFLSQGAFAGQDSVGVFHRPEKVVILLNEYPGQGERLKNFIQNFGTEKGFEWLSEDQSVRIYCAYTVEMSSCTIRLLPSEYVTIGKRAVSAGFPFPKADLKMSFESSMMDRFELKIENQALSIEASKR